MFGKSWSRRKGGWDFLLHSALGAEHQADRRKGTFIASVPCHQPPPPQKQVLLSLYQLLQQMWRFTEKPLWWCFRDTGVPSGLGCAAAWSRAFWPHV